MEEQEKMNAEGVTSEEEQNAAAVPAQNAKEGSPQGASPQAAGGGYSQAPGGYPQQFGFAQPAQGIPFQPMYGYQQAYAQQSAYPNAGYPQQGAKFGYQQGGATGAGQYNYKASYNQSSSSPNSGAGPGEYDFRSARNQPKAPQPQPQQFAYPGYPQFQYGQQPGAVAPGYGYYPQGQMQYPYNQAAQQYNYQQAYAQQALNYPNMRPKEAPKAHDTENGEAVLRPYSPDAEESRSPLPKRVRSSARRSLRRARRSS